ncbi:hypothetical protein [Streptomyces sp. NBC_00986]|uniref:hypothetical protein n=1 Tax=Streptomyces sp. NBC_00986 TaxID=2903702 RepID=UPI003869AFD0|nr:hypothetical protein OG504_36460 [Streptomyces sp. NBC_00986]
MTFAAPPRGRDQPPPGPQIQHNRAGEERAAQLVHAAGSGTVISLVGLPEAPVSDHPGPVPAAVALRAVLQRTDVLTDGELSLLREWLDRIARSTT